MTDNTNTTTKPTVPGQLEPLQPAMQPVLPQQPKIEAPGITAPVAEKKV